MLTFKQMQYSYISERLVVFQPAISRQQSWYVLKHFFEFVYFVSWQSCCFW